MDVLMPILTMGALGLILSAGLAIAYQKLKVEEDPKVVKISEALPQANCGACGYSGCRAFAEAVVKGEAETNGCPVGGEETITKVAEIMGVKADEVVKKIARILCHGDTEAAKDRGTYLGITTCYAANLTGGNKQCPYGCLGFGDCVLACPFEAIHMGGDGLPVVDGKKCTACGKCVEACPRNIIELAPLAQNMFVFCRNLDKGAAPKKACKNACIGCGICARACPEAIIMENNLAIIKDYKKINPEKIPAIEKCPTNAIGRLCKEDER